MEIIDLGNLLQAWNKIQVSLFRLTFGMLSLFQSFLYAINDLNRSLGSILHIQSLVWIEWLIGIHGRHSEVFRDSILIGKIELIPTLL